MIYFIFFLVPRKYLILYIYHSKPEIYDGTEIYVPWFLYGTSKMTMVLPWYMSKRPV